MSLRSWFGLNGVDNDKHDHVLHLADEVTALIRERAKDPLTVVVSDLFLRRHDPALIADAYEASQESRIYKGPES